MRSISIVVVFCALISMSCNPKYYTPNTQNVPLLSGKGETNLTVSGNGNQAEFQGAYAVANSVGIMANGGLFFPKDLDNGNGGSGNFLELGAGYIAPTPGIMRFEVFGLAGVGKMENHLPSTLDVSPQTTGDISANITRIGIQPNFGIKTDFFSAAASARFVNLQYNNIKGSLIFEGEDQVAYLENNKSTFLFEPAITIRAGLPKVKFQLQLGSSFNLTNNNFRQDQAFGTFGLNFNFAE